MRGGFFEDSAPSTGRPRGVALEFGGDEAGRGPVLGPMVLALVGLTPQEALALRELGVADSKHFGTGAAARARRGQLDLEIRARASAHSLEIVSVETIDRYTLQGGLNRLEQEVMGRLLDGVTPAPTDAIVCDGARLFAPLRAAFPQLRALDRAEDLSTSVAAASILAKHARDLAFSQLAAKYRAEFGELCGGGYPNAATYRFIDAYLGRYGELPPEARRSWQRAPAQISPPMSSLR